MFLLISAALCLGQPATDTNLSPAQIEGCALAQDILAQRPATNSSLTGLLKIRDEKGARTEMPMKLEVVVTETNWTSIYEKTIPTNLMGFDKLVVKHDFYNSNQYELTYILSNGERWTKDKSEVVVRMSLPFAGDFLAMDLGLEFFHWQEQKVLKHEMKRGRSCKVLESVNPNPSTNGYSRVVSWIDNESLGIVQAEAYDFKNKLLKEFAPKSFKKVNGQWELHEMEIRNVQTGSRTRLEFNPGAD